MATPSDDKKAAAKKTTTKAASKTTASKTGAKKTAPAAPKAPAKKAPAKKAVKKAATKDTASKATASKDTSSANKPLNFDFSDSVQVESKSRAKTAPKSDGFDKAKEHAGRAFEELSTAAVAGFEHVSKKLDAASIKAQREAKEALKKSEQWIKEHPVAASVAGSAVAGTVTAVFKKLIKR